ncbi:MAG: alpha/beta hydrolase family protein, partial [Planctomycetes bacterium]|nr:alpha/beta hydrolase family protein [Planctomycetota bacterium]
NNTVHAEYFTPNVPVSPRAPAAIVLHFLADPGFRVTRIVCEVLARRGIHALMVYMAYYGPRRPPGAHLGMLSDDPTVLVEGWRQSVLDIRLAASWLAARPDIDPQRIALTGISLGALVGSLVVSVDARFARASLVLGGGDLAEILWTAPEARELKARLAGRGLSLDDVRRGLAPIEPLRFATPALRDGVLMINALRDETIPRSSTDRLWEAMGRPEIHWYDTTHVGTAISILEILVRVTAHIEGRAVGAAGTPPEEESCPGSY